MQSSSSAASNGMQTVILAAGRGTRMGKLTRTAPKALLKVAGKTLLEHKLDCLPPEADEVIIVVGYLGTQIRERFGSDYKGVSLSYVEEDDYVGGTAHSLWKARPLLRDKFLVANADNLYARADIVSCLKYEWAILVLKKERVETGRVVVDENNLVTNVVENASHGGEMGYANTGLYLLDTRIFDYSPVPKFPGSHELGLPQTMVQAAKDIAIKAVPATFWVEIKAPEDLEKAEKILADSAA